MVYPGGTLKGMNAVLRERGIDVSRLTGKPMREIFAEMDDFKFEKALSNEFSKPEATDASFYQNTTTN